MSMTPDPFIHWGDVNARPTSLHGNGASSFERTTLDLDRVTCRLCLTLLDRACECSLRSPHKGVGMDPAHCLVHGDPTCVTSPAARAEEATE